MSSRAVLAGIFAFSVMNVEAANVSHARNFESNEPCFAQRPEDVIRVDHFTFLPTEGAASAAAAALDNETFNHQVYKSVTESGWVLYIEHLSMPDVINFNAARNMLVALAKNFGGNYGWHSCEISRDSWLKRAPSVEQ